MGGAVSAGEDNDDLIDNLVQGGYIKTPKIADIFRAVDRGHYYLEGQRNSAYYDIAWKFNHLHLSAPCIYSEVMERLDLQPGMSFLNLGSGTGYLSTMAGLILGQNGINHGVELHEDVVEYAREHLHEFIKKSPSFDKYDFCYPQFEVGNCLLIPPGNPGYDRIYCGAACPLEFSEYLMKMLSIGGKLVLPLEDQLQVKTRISENEWDSSSALAVSFAQLILPDKADEKPTETPQRSALTLQELCRFCIRRCVRNKHAVQTKPTKKKRTHRRSHGAIPTARLRTLSMRRRVNTFGDSDQLMTHEDDLTEQPSVDQLDIETPDVDPDGGMDNSIAPNQNAKESTSAAHCESNNENGESSSPTSTENSNTINGNSEAINESGVYARTRQRQLSSRLLTNNHQALHNDDTRPRSGTEGNMENHTSNGEESNTLFPNDLQLVRVPTLNDDERNGPFPNDEQLARVSGSRLAYALIHSLRRRHEANQLLFPAAEADSESSYSSTSDNEPAENGNEDKEPDIYPPLAETPFTIAIRKLPLPPRLINYLLYYRQ